MNDMPQRLDLAFRIHWEGPWHVGSGFGSAAVDRRIQNRVRKVKDHRDTRSVWVPFVPGSQLKGVVRHHCERLAATLSCKVVSPHTLGPQAPRDLLDAFTPLARSPLLVDRLFGSRYQGDCLFVDDAELEPASANPPREQRGRTAIDRLSGTARQATLFVTEVASGKNVTLKGVIHARHPTGVLTADNDGFPYEYALLVAGLLEVEALGGNRSAGLGRCRIDIVDKLRWNGHTLSVEDALACLNEAEWSDMIDLLRGG